MFEFLKKKLKGLIKRSSEKLKRKPKPKVRIKERIVRRLVEKKLSSKEFDELFEEIELTLLQANVAFEVIESLKSSLRKELVRKPIRRGREERAIREALRMSLEKILIEGDEREIIKRVKENSRLGKPTCFMFVGVNGVGKTLSLAKLGRWLQSKGFTCVFAASDTFRTASMEQLEIHGKELGVKVVKHSYGSDSCAVAWDAVEHARARGIDCVLIDTAGRQHANVNLMDELRKINRVIKPEFVVFVGDALTGNDAVEQAKRFNLATPISFSILAKADVDRSGGAIISVGHAIQKPILFLGTGQGYEDLQIFEKEKIIKMIGL
jgi:fused signal recognition particle receptor